MFILVDLTYWLRAYQYRYLDVLRTENNWAKFMWRYDLVWEPGFAWKPNFSHKSPPIFSNIKLKNIPVGLPSFPIKFEAKRSRGSWVMINKQRLLLHHIYIAKNCNYWRSSWLTWNIMLSIILILIKMWS